ncbi:hypothetical protein GGH94_001892 [Coemansia aciculifera]|uniref:CCHC-type domain-containing protein n=1 Tax=Coemansia aciculifera TaxID=417176 RepID=A0A9W8IMY3_9FUNG|nr:hypothetical protein GGH94_001892 [Coemansia aciculifera]KAJ2875356.1 hypothetical protein GGH93_001637 [Coemansia aciculifera]
MSTEEEGPAFISFSGLPDESVEDFVSSVDSLRKHFKWSNQVAFCYARTMLKGSARKLIQTATSKTAATGALGKALGDEAIDPNSWNNLKSSLLFEFSLEHAQNRLLVSLLSMRQQMGESSSEYAHRFIGIVSALVVAHYPLDSNLLAVLFASGLRSEKVKWELLMRRLNSIDKAIGYVAPDQLYKAAKLTSLLSPLPTLPSLVGSVGELSPTSDASSTFTGSKSQANLFSAGDDDDELGRHAADIVLGMDKVNLDASGQQAPRPLVLPELKYDFDNADESTAVMRGATANGASFSLDDDGDDGDEAAAVSSAMPWSVSQAHGDTTAVPDDHRQYGSAGNGFWTPPRLPDAHQRRQHRQSMSTYAVPEAVAGVSTTRGRFEGGGTSSSSVHLSGQMWTPTARPKHATMPRSSSIASTSAPGMSAYQSYDLTEESDNYYYDRDDDQMHDGEHTPPKSSESEDPAKSASELNCLADQLEHLSSMLRVQSDARRKRPRLCYRCRQKGHMASDCPLPADATVPNQQSRERMGLSSPHPPHVPSPRSNTVSSSPSALPWRASSVALYNNIVGSRNGTQSSRSASGSVTPSRRNTQSWNWSNYHGNTASTK